MFSDSMLNLATKDGALLGYALELELPNGWFRAHTGVGEILIDGNTYTGLGNLGNVEKLDTETDEKPVRVMCTLNGLNAELVNEALKSRMIGLNAQLMMLVFDNDTRRLLMAEPAIIGFITDYDVSLSADSGAVSVTIADEFELYEMPEHKYWTDESHQLDHEGDRICRYVAQMGDREIYWGSGVDAVKFNKVV